MMVAKSVLFVALHIGFIASSTAFAPITALHKSTFDTKLQNVIPGRNRSLCRPQPLLPAMTDNIHDESEADDEEEEWSFGGFNRSRSNKDPRVESMRSMLESSWDGGSMGVVPTNPEKAAEAAAESVASAMGQGHNVLMIDLRLPSYDITEGSGLFDIVAAYDFCSFLSERLRDKQLIRKGLVLVRNEKEREEIGRVRSLIAKRHVSNEGLQGASSINRNQSTSDGEVDEFRKKLIDSWDSVENTRGDTIESPTSSFPALDEDHGTKSCANVIDTKSHRLWSMIGNEDISTGSDMFDQVIAAVDQNARLMVDGESTEPEDALIILSPYDTTDIIGIRRIMARYGQTRTIIIVNSRMEKLPQELNPAVLVYGIMPLIAMSKNAADNGAEGPKVVVMKRFPKEWSVFVDIYGDGFVEVKVGGPSPAEISNTFPPGEWIVQRVKAHIEGTSR